MNNKFMKRNFLRFSACFLSFSILSFVFQDSIYGLKIRKRNTPLTTITECEEPENTSSYESSKKPIYVVLNKPSSSVENKPQYDYSPILNTISGNLISQILNISNLDMKWHGFDVKLNQRTGSVDLRSLIKSDKSICLFDDLDWNLFFNNIIQALRKSLNISDEEDISVENIRMLSKKISWGSRVVMLIPFQCSDNSLDIKIRIIDSTFGPVILCKEDFIMKLTMNQLKNALQKVFKQECPSTDDKLFIELFDNFCNFKMKNKIIRNVSSDTENVNVAAEEEKLSKEKKRRDDDSSSSKKRKEDKESNSEDRSNQKKDKENEGSDKESKQNIGNMLASSLAASAVANSLANESGSKSSDAKAKNSEDKTLDKFEFGFSIPFAILNGLVTLEKAIRGTSDDRNSKIANWVPRLGQTAGEQGKRFRDLWLGGDCSFGSGTREIAQIAAPAALAYHAYKKLTDKISGSI